MSTVVDPAVHSAWPTQPRGLSNAVLGTGTYVATAIMFFGGLISAYLVLRAGSATWPPAGQPRLPLAVTGVNTGVLLLSGILVWRALAAEQARALRLLVAATILGSVFLVIQGYEWMRLVSYGLRASEGFYGATFYAIVGAHALHALGGVITLAVTVHRMRHGLGDRSACALYWSFVVLLWPVLYVAVYLV